jgi:CRISPR-associated Cas5-like protein
VNALRHLVPHVLRRGISAQVARMHSARLERGLAAIAAGGNTIVAGPWLGEVGFELLYWVPFLRWFAATFHVAPERLLVVSRGGTASWYRPFAAGYRETFDYLTPEEFRRRHDERISANGEQKQTQVLAFERELLRELTLDVHDRSMLHPSSMYGLFNPFWWGHVGESWVHAHAAYARLTPDADAAFVRPSAPYTAVKFYFNECFPATDENRAFVRRTLRALAARGPVVSLTTGLQLDDHAVDADSDRVGDAGADEAVNDSPLLAVQTLPGHLHPRENLAVQTAAVAGASAFVGTYGGFSYLAPFLGVQATAYYSNPRGFSPRHLAMARSALTSIECDTLLDVQATAVNHHVAAK